ncbi:MAG: response regulator [Zoogloeaceae bacterium]|nr:response regulator [Rhodocyclaceae bacterium]MCP5237822.1 response regulator [Zoogloeaceae bacterium]
MLPRVLVIDDEIRLAKNIRLYLSRYGFDVQVANSGLEGLEIFATFQPAIVLLDFKLPDIDGLEVLGRLRAAGTEAHIILMTGQGSTKVAVAAMKAGACDYLSKPLVLKDLKNVLEVLAGKGSRKAAADGLRTNGP